MKKTITVLCVTLLLSACANSASHEVVSISKTTDSYMDCKDIRIETSRVQGIIDGVDKDKTDVSGRDVVDGLLWFPFNIIAKQSNYSNAKQAANARLEHLVTMSKENKC